MPGAGGDVTQVSLDRPAAGRRLYEHYCSGQAGTYAEEFSLIPRADPACSPSSHAPPDHPPHTLPAAPGSRLPALSPYPLVFSPQPSALGPRPSAISPQPSAISHQPSALSLLGPKPLFLSFQPSVLSPYLNLSPQPSVLSPQPSALSPRSAPSVRPSRVSDSHAAASPGSRHATPCHIGAQSHVKAAAERLCGSQACPGAGQGLRGTAGYLTV